MTTLHEQARAEAEKRHPLPRTDLESIYPVEAAMAARHGGFVEGAVWAATRTRVVTTVTELDALPVGSVIRNSYGAVAVRTSRLALGWRYTGSDNWYDIEDRQLPARVLYVPEENR